MQQESRADLHVHSLHSDRPSEWILRRIGAPESFVPPQEVYARAKERGMDFVTITDHNAIDGCLELADRPDTFVSVELTSYFPDERCKVHVLAYGITEAQFDTLQEVRESIYDLAAYTAREGIVTSVAHPLFAVNDRLTLAHLEQLLVLFPRFETLNGARHHGANALTEAIVANVTPELLAGLAETHGLDVAAPAKKMATGGSDDHSGLYVAGAHTRTPRVETPEAFLEMLRAGNHRPGGRSGTSLRLAHSLYRIAYGYYRQRFVREGEPGSRLLQALLERLVAESHPKKRVGPVRSVMRKLIWPLRQRRLSDLERTLVRHAVRGQAPAAAAAGKDGGPREADEDTFELACRISHHLGYEFFRSFMEHLRRGSVVESLQTFASLGPVALSIAPYLAAFGAQHKDATLLDAVRKRFAVPADVGPPRKAWVTDTFDDVNGVARTVKTLARLARDSGRDMTVLTCLPAGEPVEGVQQHNFEPIGRFEVPEYTSQKLAFPPFLKVIEHIEQQGYEEVIISTPGPLGLVALAAAKLLNLRTSGIYHTDFPQYVRMLTDDDNISMLTWRFVCWFYGQMDLIYAPSDFYRRDLVENGLGHKPIKVLRRGVDVGAFSPAKREARFWEQFGANGCFKFLYVGRISREKNVEGLVEAFRQVRERGLEAELVLVGDGPLRPQLQRQLAGTPDVVFTGYVHGERLARAYASADAFVFPSTTDTFGNVVLEAQASGLPVIVSDQGGPPEIVRRNESGIVVDVSRPGELADAMAAVYADPARRQSLAERSLANARSRSWPAILEDFWPTGEAAETASRPAC